MTGTPADFFDGIEDEMSESDERGETWKPEADTVLKGTLRNVKVQGTKDGRILLLATIEEFETEKLWAVWIGESPFMLRDEFKREAPEKGTLVAISYEGKVPNKAGTREYHKYGVKAQVHDFKWWLDLAKAVKYREEEAGLEAANAMTQGPAEITDKGPNGQTYGPDESPF